MRPALLRMEVGTVRNANAPWRRSHCQIGHEFSPILAARIGTRQRRVESGGHGVEFEADVCLGGVAQSRNGLMADGNHP